MVVLIHSVGALVVYLPPYSPDLMPIVECFKKVKLFCANMMLPMTQLWYLEQHLHLCRQMIVLPGQLIVDIYPPIS